mmetsp:Transcript_20992/g.43168  ORF Transcript_20992/g.43168 Transcript_20992/m.43168 type:complete len:88 (+) Transcript_20992:981-1244(+)
MDILCVITTIGLTRERMLTKNTVMRWSEDWADTKMNKTDFLLTFLRVLRKKITGVEVIQIIKGRGRNPLQQGQPWLTSLLKVETLML